MKTLLFSAFLISTAAFAGEYNDIQARNYQAQQAAAGGQELARYATYSARVGAVLRGYIQKSGGDPNQASCKTSTGYSCQGSLCTPGFNSTLNLNELGAPGHLFRSCDFSLPGDRACQAGGDAECYRLGDPKEVRRCERAQVVVSCVNRATGKTSGDYINSL